MPQIEHVQRSGQVAHKPDKGYRSKDEVVVRTPLSETDLCFIGHVVIERVGLGFGDHGIAVPVPVLD